MATEDPFYRSFNNRTSALSLLKYHKFQAYQLKNELREYLSFLPTRKKRFKIEDIYLSDDVCKVKLKPRKKKLYRNIIITEEQRGSEIEVRRSEIEGEAKIRIIGEKIDEKNVTMEVRKGKIEGRQDKNVGKGKGDKEENGGSEGSEGHIRKRKNFEQKETNNGEKIDWEEEEEEVNRKLKANQKWNQKLNENRTLDFHWKIKRTNQANFEAVSKTSQNFRIKTANEFRKSQNGEEKHGKSSGRERMGEDERVKREEPREVKTGSRGRTLEEHLRGPSGGVGKRKGCERKKRDKPFLYKERNEMGSVSQFMSKYLEFTAKI